MNILMKTFATIYFVAILPILCIADEPSKPTWFISFREASHFLIEGKILENDETVIEFKAHQNGKLVGESHLVERRILISERGIRLLKTAENPISLQLDITPNGPVGKFYTEIQLFDGLPVTEGRFKPHEESWFIVDRLTVAGQSLLRIVAQVHKDDQRWVDQILDLNKP
jgi:hypothetical protein